MRMLRATKAFFLFGLLQVCLHIGKEYLIVMEADTFSLWNIPVMLTFFGIPAFFFAFFNLWPGTFWKQVICGPLLVLAGAFFMLWIEILIVGCAIKGQCNSAFVVSHMLLALGAIYSFMLTQPVYFGISMLLGAFSALVFPKLQKSAT